MDEIDELLTRSVDKIYPSSEALERVLRSGKKLRLYQGIDPTGFRLHLGHSIPLAKIQQFAKLGHEVILLFGTGTVLVGDPSDRNQARKKITQSEIEENIKTWKEQVSTIVDFGKVTIKQNADWLLELKLKDIIEIASHISAVQLIKRDSFKLRINKGDTVWYHETLYPLLQGYDSVAMNVDLEVGGTDQTFNMLIGRELLQKMRNKEKFVLTTPMIMGTDGKKMSKTSGNCVWLSDSAEDMYGKIMSIPDTEIEPYFNLLTSIDFSRVKMEINGPMNQKKRLAKEITQRFHGAEKAKAAEEYFEKTVQEGKVPEDIPSVTISLDKDSIVNILAALKLVSSKSEAKRIVRQGGVEIDGNKIKDINREIELKDGTIIKMGKRTFVKIKARP